MWAIMLSRAAHGCWSDNLGGILRLLGWQINGWEEKFAVGIVRLVALQGEVAVLHGVAVDAAVWAGIVLADIAGGGAGALFPIALLPGFVKDGTPGDAFEALGIDAARLLDESRLQESFLRTDAQLHATRGRDVGQFGGKVASDSQESWIV